MKKKEIKILLVDDEKCITDPLMQLLTTFFIDDELFFVNAEVAMDGFAGYELAIRFNPDIILTDSKMPKMTGSEMIEKIQNSGFSPLVIFCCGDIGTVSCKYHAHFEKPVEPRKLLLKIQQILLQKFQPPILRVEKIEAIISISV